MPFCRHCGVEHGDADRYCPSCGRRIERMPGSPTEPPPAEPRRHPPGTRLGAVATFEHAIAGATRRGLWKLALTAFLQAFAVAVAAGLMALLVLEAAFSTVWPRRILRTSCFQQVSGFPLSGATYSWNGHNYRLRAGCDPIRPHVSTAGLALASVAAVVVIGAVVAVGAVALYRRCDRQAGSGRRWSVLPGIRPIVRATYRQIGWGIAFYVGATLAVGIAAIPIGTTARTASGGGAGVLILIELVAYAYLAIRWVVPWLVRVYLAWVRMLLDDTPLPVAYRAVPRLGVGAGWALVGLSIAIAIVIALVAALLTGIAPALQLPLQLAASTVESMVFGAFAVAAMRNAAGELDRDADRAREAPTAAA
jgi:hypothetical protein